MRKRLFFFSFCLFLGACQADLPKNEDKKLDAVRIDDGSDAAQIIRNPVSASQPVDTVNVAKLTFSEVKYDFGEVFEGDIVTHSFQFQNTGTVPLVISGARSTCGCTVPEWPKQPIQPGEGGEIKVKFNTLDKTGVQDKPVTVVANTFPNETKVHLTGTVLPKN